MKYFDGTTVSLGDVVRVPTPKGTGEARVVMLGETYEHLDIDPNFLSWVQREKKLEPSSIVVEWLGVNPFAHKDPRYAPVGNYLFSPVDEFVELISK
jgi:hypothetical protein